MPYEIIRFKVTGNDAQTLNVPVLISPSGTGNASFSFHGLTPGVDIVQALYDEKGLSSNQVSATWQPSTYTSQWGYSFFLQSAVEGQTAPSDYTNPGNIGNFYYADRNAGAAQDTSITVGSYIYVTFTYNGQTIGPYYARVNSVGLATPPTSAHQFWYFTILIPGPAQSIYLPGANMGGKQSAVTSYTVVPASSTATLANGNPQLKLAASQTNPVGSLATFTLTISGISFTQTPYVPLLQGVPGQLYVSDASGVPTNFNFPGLPNGGTVDRTAAAKLFSISGLDNSSWQNRLSIAPTSTGYQLYYNGAAPDSGVASTMVQVAYDEISWFDPASGNFDTYTPTAQGGGSSAKVQAQWLIQPKIASVTPASIPGDGGTHTLTITLAAPLPPVQSSAVIAKGTYSSTAVPTSFQANLNSAGFTTGWTVSVQTAVAHGTAVTFSFLLSDPQQTYLQGDAFVTAPINYSQFAAQNFNISLT